MWRPSESFLALWLAAFFVGFVACGEQETPQQPVAAPVAPVRAAGVPAAETSSARTRARPKAKATSQRSSPAACRSLVSRTCALVGVDSDQCVLMKEYEGMMNERQCQQGLQALRTALDSLPDVEVPASTGGQQDCLELARFACRILKDEAQCQQVRRALSALPAEQCTRVLGRALGPARVLGP